MAINVLEIMERVGSKDTKKVLKYLSDGFLKIETKIPDNTYTTYISIASGTLYYSLPTGMVDLLHVRRLYDDSTSESRYVDIPRVINVPIMKKEST